MADSLGKVCRFLNIDPFSDELISKLSEQKYNVGLNQETPAEIQVTLEQLKAYYRPFNQKLYQLLGQRYEW